MIFGITVGVSGGLTPYFNTYLWGLGTEQIGTIQLSALISALPAVILAPILARRFGKKRVCITLFLIAILTLAAPISGKLLGLTPPSGSTALVFFLAANHMLVSGLSMMGFIIVTSMIADIVEETELRTGRRSEGLLFAADNLPAEGLDRRGDLPARPDGHLRRPACPCPAQDLGSGHHDPSGDAVPAHGDRPDAVLDHLHLLLSHRPGPTLGQPAPTRRETRG